MMEKIKFYIGQLIIIGLGLFGYIFLSKNYVNNSICTKSGSFNVVRILYFLFIILILFGIKY